MSSFTSYIHYHYNNYSKNNNPNDNANFLINNYSQNKIQNQYKLAVQDLNKKLRTIFLPQLNQNNIMGEDEFFKLLNDLEKSILPKAANEMVNNLSTTNISYNQIINLDKDINNLQNVLNIFKDSIQQIIGSNSAFSKNPLPILTKDMLKSNASISDIKELYRKAYLNDTTTFKIDDNYNTTILKHKTNINKILANLSAIEHIYSGGMKNFSASEKSRTISAFLFSTLSSLNKIIGNISNDKLIEYLPQYFEDYLSKNFSQYADMKIVTASENKKSSSIFKIKTQDISMEIDFKKMLEQGQNGSISIKLPGASLKRTNIKQNRIAKINIKTNTQLAKLLDNSNFESKDLKNFYQAFAVYNMAIKYGNKRGKPAQLNKNAKNGMENMYNFFHAGMLPLALGGSLTLDDFSYFIIINNKVFNIIEIIEKIASNDDFSMVTSNLSKIQTDVKNKHNNNYYQIGPTSKNNIEGRRRSKLVVDDIRNRKIIMQLNLTLNKHLTR